MAIKKTELYSSLWASCDELRGGMDASQYKDYVLTLLFMKYVSDKYKGDPYGMIVIPQGASFDDMVALKGDKEIGDKINKIIQKLAAENDLKSVIDVADFDDEDKLGKGKEMIDRLSKLVGIFEGLDLSGNRAEGDDLLGDAYEYLMRHFATESGKSKGQFYTPAEVSRILAKVIGITPETPQDATVYDPTCGSGSLLLKVNDEARRGLSIYGQEMDNATSALARMNMILHNNTTAKIWKGNTLSDPQWKEANGRLKAFDFAVANPPFSNKNWTSGLNPKKDPFERFVWGTPPEKNGDYTFLLHIIKSLKSTGKGAVILPHGVLFRGNAEAAIRENLIKQGYIKGIIGLPANLFYGTGIPACIIVIDKEHAHSRKGIFMIDASRGFIKDGNKNRLRSRDIHRIVDVFNHQRTVPGYSRMVPVSEIASEQNAYNLNIPRYIDSGEPEDLHDLTAHLQGGIPMRDVDALQDYWQVFPALRDVLFTDDRPGYCRARVEAQQVKPTILAHQEFKDFATRTLLPFKAWVKESALDGIGKGDKPKEQIQDIGEMLLAHYANSELLNKYSAYQILMDYWFDTMQDDVYVITQDGWKAAAQIRELQPVKGKDGKNVWKEAHDFEFTKRRYKADVLPRSLIEKRCFPALLEALNSAQERSEEASRQLAEFIEEQAGEDDLLAEAKNDKDKVTQKLVNARLIHLKKITADPDELAALTRCLALIKAEANAKKAQKAAQEALDRAVFKHYPTLDEPAIKTLVVQDKWLATLQAGIKAEIERITQQLAERVKELEERYTEPLPALEASVEALSEKVAEHLRTMGLVW
ncbi:type I restriction-modification protein subunit M [Pectobacterium brasiliense]|uniref:site-specific DNA-methyltransferase (adenine-specific) n=1 Tax=Pectobacterium brasiliense TaxID=180957 RepID=A0A0M2F7J9_9GAMM|nr:type I restriction-modification system subunit M [Pectobacterium brasiliense]KGA36216.1 type I restriction-modification protein subunit M [Pectobacterium brasiliense]